MMSDEIEVRVDGEESTAGGVEFALADLVGIVEGLAVEVGKFDAVVVDDGDGADAGGGEVGGGGGAEAAAADEEDGGGFEFFLAYFADLGEEGLAGVALFFLVTEHGGVRKRVFGDFKERIVRKISISQRRVCNGNK